MLQNSTCLANSTQDPWQNELGYMCTWNTALCARLKYTAEERYTKKRSKRDRKCVTMNWKN